VGERRDFSNVASARSLIFVTAWNHGCSDLATPSAGNDKASPGDDQRSCGEEAISQVAARLYDGPGKTMKATVFFSWQSDIRGAACRTLIQSALEGAAANISGDDSIAIEAVIDRDTQSVPGAPDIGATILSKIDAAAVFVADVTIVGQTNAGRPTPNPNVLVEFGYALKTLGWSRMLLVQNAAFGGPEALPFDLRQKRAIVFSSAEDAGERAVERRALQGKLDLALRAILGGPPPAADVELTMTRKDMRITPEHHEYELVTCLKNAGTKRIDDWEIEIEFPTPLLDGTIHAIKVDERSNTNTTFFRLEGPKIKKPLRPGEDHPVRIGYFVNKDIYDRRHDLFGRLVKARALVNGEVAAEVQRSIRELQNF
jgi:hypothetical protein